jgi:hypothetical protein
MRYLKYICYLSVFLLLTVGIYGQAKDPGTASSLNDDTLNTGTKFDWGADSVLGNSKSSGFVAEPNNRTIEHKYDNNMFSKQNGSGVTSSEVSALGDMATSIGLDKALVVEHKMEYVKNIESKFYASGKSIKDGATGQIFNEADFMEIQIVNNTRDGYLITISSAGAGYLIPHNKTSAGAPSFDASTTDDVNAKNGETPIPYDLVVKISGAVDEGSFRYPNWVKDSLGNLEEGAIGYVDNTHLKTGNYLLIANFLDNRRVRTNGAKSMIESIDRSLALGDGSSSNLDSKLSSMKYKGTEEDAVHRMEEDIEETDLFSLISSEDDTSNYKLILGYSVQDFARPYMKLAGTFFERIGITYVDL